MEKIVKKHLDDFFARINIIPDNQIHEKQVNNNSNDRDYG